MPSVFDFTHSQAEIVEYLDIKIRQDDLFYGLSHRIIALCRSGHVFTLITTKLSIRSEHPQA